MQPSSGVRNVGLLFLALGTLLLASSCSKKPVGPDRIEIYGPETELTYAPVQYDTTSFRVHLYWNGYDNDGEVVRFHYAIDADSLLPITRWRTTTAKDTALLFLVDPIQELRLHSFKVAAEDNYGLIDRTPASRVFSAKTLPPRSQIDRGPAAFNGVVGPSFTFQWSGVDPDGGETGGPAPVDSFQYMLLRVGSVADTTLPHDPLPPFNLALYTQLIRSAFGDGLPAGNAATHTRWDDWKWIGLRALQNRFRNVAPGEYVFALRAVDIAGAREQDLAFVRNIRHFTVTTTDAGPWLIVRSNIATGAVAGGSGPKFQLGSQLQMFQGETASFSWNASAQDYGGEVVGYTYALDDTSTFPVLDPRATGVTFEPSQLPPGPHFFYVRAVDDGGLVSNAVVRLLVIHPTFKDPGAARSILFVDDSVVQLGNGSGPNDQIETQWWTERGATGDGPLIGLGGVPYTEWDTSEQGLGSVEGRKAPSVSDLAGFSTVVWTTDFQNSGSVQTALFKTVAGEGHSELQEYLRAGGTLILTGWNLAQNTSGRTNDTFKRGGPAPDGICAAFAPGSAEYQRTTFARMYMGIDNSVPSAEGLRSRGAFDFVSGTPTAAGMAMGFDTARVDTGNFSYGVQYPGVAGDPAPTFKWNTNAYPPPIAPDERLFPGLSGIEGWIMASNFGCQPIQNFGMENSGLPVVQPVYTYHGAPEGPLLDGPPSPREGLVCGSLAQSHDLGTNSGNYAPTTAVGRTAFFTFPLYFLKDADAINIMKKSYEYVSTSPTLP